MDVRTIFEEALGADHPSPAAQSRLLKDLENSRIAMRAVAPILYLAFQHYLGDHETPWHQAPADVRRDLTERAELAVRSVLPEHRREALRVATLQFRAAVKGALRGVLDVAVVRDPQSEHRVRQLLATVEEALLSYTHDDIAGALVNRYERELRMPGLECDK